MKYIQLTILSKNYIDNSKRKDYLNKFFIDKIDKFTHAIGFKPVQLIITNNNEVIDNTVKNPINYKTPDNVLYNSIRPSVKDKELSDYSHT